ncbi:MAG: glutamine--tRNA ligase/YqeY domain fusion protein [Candidatus Eisenbacteria bacterium]|uniref:Glutamine--tRNA ligase n=1 Tax=Eiseniibacteriota bacterium TaxID=2212470 RepID=A0A7Y2E5Q8_UNCEI|nr:glutamine--tRNA ligase/YqeY domain fusion protein [Candidatus Eisenbacteria bacterium]
MSEEKKKDFIREAIDADIAEGRFDGRVHTRFPPEPNGYLHIGHAKAFGLNFQIAEDFGGKCNLRFDDTNPTKESTEFVDAIIEDIKWMGYDWEDRLFYASDYYETLFDYAMQLIDAGKAYVDDLSGDEIREYRGTLKEPGKPSPWRDRSPEENRTLFQEMRDGKHPDGSKVLRAKIDMASPNINMRDPVMYRILRAHHHRTGDAWCIYPMYDWAHGQSDSLESITHSLCSLEFEDHRPLYEWFLENLGIYAPRQIEFARLKLTNTVMSKRKLRTLVEEGVVDGWDDPRMPTLSGMRRRGYPPAAIKDFLSRMGVAKRDSVIDIAQLEFSVRENLNKNAPRVMAVLKPLKVVITNYPEDQVEHFTAINNPEDESAGTRELPFSREIYVETTDFWEDPPKKFHRLGPGREVRLKHAYYITFQEAIKNDAGEVVELRCTYDPESRGASTPDGRKVRGTIHWVSVPHAKDAEVRNYDRLFLTDAPDTEENWQESVNPDALETLQGAKVEPSLAEADPGSGYQFMRHGYYALENKPTSGDKLIFHRTVPLRDSWGKTQKKS